MLMQVFRDMRTDDVLLPMYIIILPIILTIIPGVMEKMKHGHKEKLAMDDVSGETDLPDDGRKQHGMPMSGGENGETSRAPSAQRS